VPSNPTSQVRLAELTGGLSLATDLSAGLAPESALRICVLATELGRDLGLTGQALSDVYYTGLLRFLGTTAISCEAAALMGGDDHAALRKLAVVDPASPASVLAFVTRELGKGARAGARAGMAARFLADRQAFAQLAAAQCNLAMTLAHRLGMRTTVVQSLGQMFERFDGKGLPNRFKSDALHAPARILHLASLVEVQRQLLGADVAVDSVRRSQGRIDPLVSEAFLKRPQDHLVRLSAPSMWIDFLASEPEPRRVVAKARLGDIAEAFARHVDMKSPFTLTHSTGVSRLVTEASIRSRRTHEDVETLRVAALLHDLGRTSVPNGIWDKAGPLTPGEVERARQHVPQTDRILKQASPFATVARLAGLHHERLDGTGYARGVSGVALPFGARLIAAADMFHALTEARPHRPALMLEEAGDVLTNEARTGRLDRAAVESVLSTASATHARVRGAWPAHLSEREVEVLRLMARGLSPKELAAKLGSPVKAVQQTLQSIYAKTEISTRPAAALYAMEQNLIEYTVVS
jgi:HD-GYP domain-containing protein (c-di-GMP phosphodiesterase class II)